MPHLWILGSIRNETNCDLAERWRASGLAAEVLSPEDAAERVLPDDTVLGRVDVLPSVDGVEQGLAELAAAARRGARILNRPAPILQAHDKLLTARALAAAGVPHPRTAHLWPGEQVPLEPPLVLKPRFGSWGVDVYRCLDADEVAWTLELLAERRWFRRQGTIVQELVQPLGYDVRVVVAGGAVVGSQRRVAAPGEWRNNISLGGSYWPAPASARERALAIAAVTALDGDLFGVDLLPTRDGDATVLEVNAAVEFEDAYGLDGRDVFAETATALGLESSPALECPLS